MVIKLSGLGMFTQHSEYSNEFLSKIDIIDFCINTFGIKRFLFRSNFPVNKLYGNYLNCLTTILEIDLIVTELKEILYENAFPNEHKKKIPDSIEKLYEQILNTQIIDNADPHYIGGWPVTIQSQTPWTPHIQETNIFIPLQTILTLNVIYKD